MCPHCCGDALKPATPLTNGVINETLLQFDPQSDISRGSVATQLRCGGIFSDSIIANLLLIRTVKHFENRLIFDKVKAHKNCAIFRATLYNFDMMTTDFQHSFTSRISYNL